MIFRKKDRKYEIKARTRDRPLATEYWVESMNSGEYTFITLPCKEYGGMIDFCHPVNKKIFVRKNGAFHLKYSMEFNGIRFTLILPLTMSKLFSTIISQMFLVLKQNIINWSKCWKP